MKLEKYLNLNKYLLSLFGVNSISDLREELKNKKEGFDNDGKSFFVDTLIGLENLRRYFYKDGYGKDFYLYNLREDSFTKNYKDLILTANLLKPSIILSG